MEKTSEGETARRAAPKLTAAGSGHRREGGGGGGEGTGEGDG